ncbi:MAG: UDP-N-acetylmuramoyl-L-alanyl-D-glutamate--2,6-diaminopimelate ligase [Saprospirales bacterium]|nr:UDP-N-acetylmuramoyl-L-alanyl-D-glutamate--2,6-diaminopimelate ligase [Saprospirales bacterium]
MPIKTLSELLIPAPGIRKILGNTAIGIRQIRFDSRAVQPGDCFVALRGAIFDGHQFINEAIKNGAVAVVGNAVQMEDDLELTIHKVIPTLVLVDDTAEVSGQMAAAYYDYPSRRMQVVGITGTNGKTTTTTLLYQLYTALGQPSGLIGTVGNRIGAKEIPSTHTTPDALGLQHLLRQMADAGCTRVFMETSSHAIHQRRIAGVAFAGAVFTNLTHDHLDYHQTFAAYRDVKKQLFDALPASAFALTNADDKNGRFLLQNTAAQTYTYGLRSPADFKAKILENGLAGLQLQLDGETFHARLIGEFNAYNLAAVYATARLLGAPKTPTLIALSNLRGAEGRFEAIPHPTKPDCLGIVDYAHTPDALEQVLGTIAQLKKRQSRVITVVGCGGDRDKTKRPLMARVAAAHSDQLILTSDNPRTENPAAILSDMEAGLGTDDYKKTLTIENREQAIKTACRLAGPGDIILVAGKGHEKYQDINGVKLPFDDKALLLQCFGA